MGPVNPSPQGAQHCPLEGAEEKGFPPRAEGPRKPCLDEPSHRGPALGPREPNGKNPEGCTAKKTAGLDAIRALPFFSGLEASRGSMSSPVRWKHHHLLTSLLGRLNGSLLASQHAADAQQICPSSPQHLSVSRFPRLPNTVGTQGGS